MLSFYAQHRSQLTCWASNYSAADKCQASTVTAGAALALTTGPDSFTLSSRSHSATVGTADACFLATNWFSADVNVSYISLLWRQ